MDVGAEFSLLDGGQIVTVDVDLLLVLEFAGLRRLARGKVIRWTAGAVYGNAGQRTDFVALRLVVTDAPCNREK